MNQVGRRRLLVLSSILGALCCACSVDPTKHKDYRPDCDSGTETRSGVFCFPKPVKDAGEPPDAGPDADGGLDAAPIDATVPMTCSNVYVTEFCYP